MRFPGCVSSRLKPLAAFIEIFYDFGVGPMQEHADLSKEIYDLLEDGRQLSISGITRELKARDFNEHRLIVTGYLRALADMGQLNEFDLSPSKIYTLKTDGKKPAEKKADEAAEKGSKKPEPKKNAEIYALIGDKISKITPSSARMETAVYLLITLFDRPCFESELNSIGIDSAQIFKYFGAYESASQTASAISPQLVFKAKSDYKKYYDEIPSIPKNSPAYEISFDRQDSDFLRRAVNILSLLLKEEIDVSDLVSKTANKSLLDFY